MDVALAVAADYANVASDGKLNIMGIFQEVNPPVVPFQLPQMYLVLSWEAAPAEFGSQKHVRVTFMGPEGPRGDEDPTLEYDLVVPEALRPGTRAIFHQILGIGGLPISRAGPHAFYVLTGGDTKATVSLYVNEPTTLQGKET
jgi:hypothetical protein